MPYGTLAKRPELKDHWPHSSPIIDPIQREILTRYEEYHFVLENIPYIGQGPVLDGGCGYVPNLHILPQLIAKECGRIVVALDSNPEHLVFQEPRTNVIRMTGDLCGLPFAMGSFDVTTCISTLEHLIGPYRSLALAQLCRVTENTLILTFDGLDIESFARAVKVYGLDAGERLDEEGETLVNDKDEEVCYLIAQRTAGWTKVGPTVTKEENGTLTEEIITRYRGWYT